MCFNATTGQQTLPFRITSYNGALKCAGCHYQELQTDFSSSAIYIHQARPLMYIVSIVLPMYVCNMLLIQTEKVRTLLVFFSRSKLIHI